MIFFSHFMFLQSVDVMDYSLLVGVDDERKELVLGIIDFMRQYTWDKHLETWVKASGILGGPKKCFPHHYFSQTNTRKDSGRRRLPIFSLYLINGLHELLHRNFFCLNSKMHLFVNKEFGGGGEL